MPPDRGDSDLQQVRHADNHQTHDEDGDDAASILAARAAAPQNFTLRSLIIGLLIGVVICFSNTYFGLQTGWISGMAMPSALLGFAWFKSVSKFLSFPFTPVENVLVQTVAGAVGTMPLGCGFVGVIPALELLLKPSETPGGEQGLHLPLGKLVIWALGICFFGVFFAVPLRKEVIIREKLKFPSGTATALMIGVLHGGSEDTGIIRMDADDNRKSTDDHGDEEEERRLIAGAPSEGHERREEQDHRSGYQPEADIADENGSKRDDRADWKANVKLLTIAFTVSAVYTVLSYFIPHLHDIPFLGLPLATNWLWTLNPSPAYVGQGIIMGSSTTLHMLLGAIVGWGILSPMAKRNGWAPGPVDDWEHGSKGWIVWVSLAIMLADAIVSLGWLVLRPTITLVRTYGPAARESVARGTWREDFRKMTQQSMRGYSPVHMDEPGSPTEENHNGLLKATSTNNIPEPDAPPEHQIGIKTTVVGLFLSLVVCVAAVHVSFASLIPLGLTILALLLALLLSIMGVRAQGETDLNPVSGISKLTQLFFALATPRSSPNAIIINLIAGAISESGALQAGDLMQDLKTGHLLGASPKAQFYGQMIGSAVGAVVSACVYKLYISVYEVPGGMFQVPTAYVWIFTARLVTGQGLPPKVGEWAAGAAALFAVLTAMRIYGNMHGWRYTSMIPGGIAVAVGMYNTPSFTLARTAGGLISAYWMNYRKNSETPIIVLASGLILGEGLLSIANLGLASLRVPHL
ncbi:hypothetical protein MBLNU457_4310t1 [Dothideomycetes sp. NU457]